MDGHFSPMELQDFDQFLRNSPGYRKSEFTTFRYGYETPMTVIFFGDEPSDPNRAEFHIMEDRPRHAITIQCISGDSGLLNDYLEKYGFVKLDKDLIEEKSADVVRLMNDPDILEFLKDRKIKPEDLLIVETALSIPRDIYLNNHNTPQFQREKLEEFLTKEVEELKDRKEDPKLKYAETMLSICKQYGWETAWNLNSVMERVAPRRIENA